MFALIHAVDVVTEGLWIYQAYFTHLYTGRIFIEMNLNGTLTDTCIFLHVTSQIHSHASSFSFKTLCFMFVNEIFNCSELLPGKQPAKVSSYVFTFTVIYCTYWITDHYIKHAVDYISSCNETHKSMSRAEFDFLWQVWIFSLRSSSCCGYWLIPLRLHHQPYRWLVSGFDWFLINNLTMEAFDASIAMKV